MSLAEQIKKAWETGRPKALAEIETASPGYLDHLIERADRQVEQMVGRGLPRHEAEDLALEEAFPPAETTG